VGKELQRIDVCNLLKKALLGALSDLADQVGGDIAAVGKRVDVESENRSQATANMAARLEKDIEKGAQATAQLKVELDQAFERLTAALDSTSDDMRSELAAARSDLTAAIDTAQSELEERKLDRGALAALLSATASEL